MFLEGKIQKSAIKGLAFGYFFLFKKNDKILIDRLFLVRCTAP